MYDRGSDDALEEDKLCDFDSVPAVGAQETSSLARKSPLLSWCGCSALNKKPLSEGVKEGLRLTTNLGLREGEGDADS
jgi:hypothetical protein